MLGSGNINKLFSSYSNVLGLGNVCLGCKSSLNNLGNNNISIGWKFDEQRGGDNIGIGTKYGISVNDDGVKKYQIQYA